LREIGQAHALLSLVLISIRVSLESATMAGSEIHENG
jgi:hypothetical protein